MKDEKDDWHATDHAQDMWVWFGHTAILKRSLLRIGAVSIQDFPDVEYFADVTDYPSTDKGMAVFRLGWECFHTRRDAMIGAERQLRVKGKDALHNADSMAKALADTT